MALAARMQGAGDGQRGHGGLPSSTHIGS